MDVNALTRSSILRVKLRTMQTLIWMAQSKFLKSEAIHASITGYFQKYQIPPACIGYGGRTFQGLFCVIILNAFSGRPVTAFICWSKSNYILWVSLWSQHLISMNIYICILSAIQTNYFISKRKFHFLKLQKLKVNGKKCFTMYQKVGNFKLWHKTVHCSAKHYG